MEETQILDIRSAARFVGLKPSTLYALVSARKIPHLKLGRAVRFEKKMLSEWIESHRVSAISR